METIPSLDTKNANIFLITVCSDFVNFKNCSRSLLKSIYSTVKNDPI